VPFQAFLYYNIWQLFCSSTNLFTASPILGINDSGNACLYPAVGAESRHHDDDLPIRCTARLQSWPSNGVVVVRRQAKYDLT
jgi:hypothetical protein